jgi:nucleoid DNA-binding protein
MNLGLHIFNLLQEKGKVELPGMGVFTLHKKSAQLDQATATLLPPAQEIYFQKNNLVFNSDLSKYIAGKTGENLFEVQTQLKEEVLAWQEELGQNKHLHIDELGDFSENQGEIAFFSGSEFAQNPNYFGLEEISLKEIQEREIFEADLYGHTCKETTTNTDIEN